MFCGAIRDLKLDDDLELKEEKTGKLRRVTLNKACISALQALLASNNKAPPPQDLLFVGTSWRFGPSRGYSEGRLRVERGFSLAVGMSLRYGEPPRREGPSGSGNLWNRGHSEVSADFENWGRAGITA
jgi:hypothetical protein